MTAFNLTIETTQTRESYLYGDSELPKVIEVRSFNTKIEANKELKRMVKEEGFEKLYGGLLEHYDKNLEVFKNY